MDEETSTAVNAHLDRFGELDINIMGLNLSDPAVKQELLTAIAIAMDSGVPIKESDVSVTFPDDALI